jgi:hypothetical protein
MFKRGQITLFVIIAVLIIGAVSVFVLFQTNVIKAPVSSEQAQKIVAAQTGPVRDHVEGCMKTAVMKSLNTLGRQGGYMLPKTDRFSIPSSVMADAPAITYAYFYDNSLGSYVNLLPSVAEMKNEFSGFIAKNPDFEICIDDFSSFKKTVSVKAGPLNINSSSIDFGEKNNKIVVNFNYPAEISKQDAKTLINDYQVSIPIDLNKIHENAATIINAVSAGKSATIIMQEQAKMQEQILRENPGSDVIFISSNAYDEIDTDVAGQVYNTKNILYTISYNNAGLEEPFEFKFLVGEK